MAAFNVAVFLLAVTQISAAESEQSKKLKISVYYEALCPDCIGFILEQLAPTLGKLKNHLTLDLIPHGKVWKFGDKFECQHGPRECAGNKLDACAIDQLITKTQPPQQEQLIQFLSCTFSREGDPLKDAEQCLPKTGVDLKLLTECFNGARGEELVAGHGNRTRALQPSLSWVPTVVFNDRYNEKESSMAQDNLLQVVCSYLPNHCK